VTALEDRQLDVGDLSLLLSRASHALEVELSAALVGVGITPRWYWVLSKATTAELTQIVLADLCGLDKTTMVSTLDDLEVAGLAERRPASNDRRARVVSVTRNGQRLVRKAESIVDAVYADVLGELPAREREAFVSGLARLVSGRLGALAECDRPHRPRAARGPVGLATLQ
jgi:DNA-binding MarR family transcriptional regulator